MPSIGPISIPAWKPYSNAVLQIPNLYGYWPLNEAAGTRAVDAFGGHPGVYVNAPTLGETGPIAGEPGSGVKFVAASTQFVSVGSFSGAPADTVTLMAWVKRTTIGTAQTIFSAGTNSWALLFGDDTVLFDKENVGTVVASPALTDTTGWHFIVATKVGSASTVGIDGVRTTASNGATLSAAGATSYFGYLAEGANPLNATLAHLAIVGRAISQAEESALYTRGITP